MQSDDTSGEKLFAHYLDTRDLRYVREPEIGSKRPDFVISTRWGTIAAEVFEPTFDLPRPAGFFDSIEPLKAAFTTNKRKQTQAAREAGLPIIMVIGSDRAPLPFDMFSIVSVMFGREGVAVPLDGGAARSVRMAGAKVQPTTGTSVSAMAILQRFQPVNRPAPDLWPARLVICHNPFAAIPLPLDFPGAHDEQYAGIENSGRIDWMHVASGRLVPEIADVYQ
jgi:hypothetical protein